MSESLPHAIHGTTALISCRPRRPTEHSSTTQFVAFNSPDNRARAFAHADLTLDCR